MDWTKFFEEFWRIARIAAANIGGAFGALAAVGKPITGNAVLDIVICGVLNAVAFGTSRASDGKSIVPGVSTKVPMLFLAMLLGFGVASFASIGVAGCGTGQRVRNTVEVPALSFVAQAVEEDVQAGIAVSAGDKDLLAAESGAFFDAVRSKDRTQIRNEAWPRWSVIKSLASDGLNAQVSGGTLSVEAAELGREQLRRFENMLVQLITP